MRQDADVANEVAATVTESNRIPMGTPDLKLQVPEIEGYHLHWFADRPGRIPRAMAAGYEFVTPEECKVRNFGFASDVIESGNTDLGSRVSVHGGVDEHGRAERLYLMKIKNEWHEKDMALREETQDKLVDSLRQGQVGAQQDPNARLRYVNSVTHRGVPQYDLFKKKAPKG